MYGLFKKYLFSQDPETIHERILSLLETAQNSQIGRSLLRSLSGAIPARPVVASGISFVHPVGLAAGFDKNARAVAALQELGFSFVEIGTVTPLPQDGNPKPRIWRFPEAKALVNALGFPGEGMIAVRNRLEILYSSSKLKVPLGINIGKNAVTPPHEAQKDYVKVLETLKDFGDYFVVNVSSPNTAGLRDLQNVEALRIILESLLKVQSKKPLFLKIAPDLADEDVIAIAELSKTLSLAGIVSANTTIQRKLVSSAADLDRGGLSGAPLYPRTQALLTLLRQTLAPHQTLIAVGGISSAQQVHESLANGANLVQIYTSFIYQGPKTVSTLLRT